MSKSKPTSYPKDKIKILLLENISDVSVEEFKEAGYTNVKKLSAALDEKELIQEIKDVHLLGIRSKTQVTEKVLARANKLLGIGCYCIGINQVNIKSATENGVAVFNAPHANTRSVAELVIGLSIMLIRKITDKSAAAHKGIWQKDAKGSFELRGKTLGIIGYGNIGSQVSVMAEAMGMDVIYFDAESKLPHGNARQIRSLRELMKRSNIVTLHVPSEASTRYMINAETLAYMKKGSFLINYSRGDVVDLEALKAALQSGQLAGAAIDVFPEEPEKNGAKFETVLQNLPNVILTPHIGGSTEEAQLNIGLDVTSKLLNYLEKGSSVGSHSVPQLNLSLQAKTHRILHIHKNVPGVLGEINSKLSSHGINILGQYLKTNDTIGYVVLDVDTTLSKEALALLKEVKSTIKVRMLY
jgi:D-3-phosphoglycerate dehydrogenase